MNPSCPENHEWLRLLDGEATENRAAELRVHADACPRCARELGWQRQLLADLAAPMAISRNATQAVLQRVASTPDLPRGSGRSRLGLVLGALAAAAAVALFVVPRMRERGDFQARGSRPAWTQRVGTELWALEDPPRKLAAQAPLSSATPLVASYYNLDHMPAYLLAFAVDGQGELHWAYPGYEDPKTDPEAVRLDPLQMQRALPETVVLDALPNGPLDLITVVSRTPLRVSQIESLPATERSLGSLKARFPGARIDSLSVQVSTSAKEIP